MVVEAFRPFGALRELVEERVDRRRQRFGARRARRHEAAEGLAAFAEVLEFGAVVWRTVERRVSDRFVGDGNAEAGAEGAQVVLVHLLLLVRDVPTFTSFAKTVALDGPDEHDRRLPLVLGRGLVGVIDLDRIVTAEAQLLQLVIGHVLDHVKEPRVGAEEVLAEVRTRLDCVLLVLTVDHFGHPLRQQAFVVVREQRIPIAAPQHLDDVPAGAAEDRLELLDDLTVAAHRPVKTLQVAVDDENQVVELFARRQADGAERLGLVGLAVTEERPDLHVRGLLQAAIFQVAVEARLVDRHDGAKAHRDRRELPEVRHQPRVRIRRQAAALRQLLPEVGQLLRRQPAFEKRARIDTR